MTWKDRANFDALKQIYTHDWERNPLGEKVMNEQVFSVFDKKASYFLPMFQSPNPETAIRSIKQNMLNKDHPFTRNPEDYQLFRIGVWYPHTAKFQLDEPHIFIAEIEDLDGNNDPSKLDL